MSGGGGKIFVEENDSKGNGEISVAHDKFNEAPVKSKNITDLLWLLLNQSLILV